MKGWYQHSYEHGLARRGISTAKYRKKFPSLVKPFKGQNPRLTKKYARFRQASPASFIPGTFRVKRISPDKELILAKRKRDKSFAVQSVLVKRGKFFSVKKDVSDEDFSEEMTDDDIDEITDDDIDEMIREEKKKRREIRQIPEEFYEEDEEDIDESMYARKVLKKGKVHVTKSGAEVVRLAKRLVTRLRGDAARISVAGSIRRGVGSSAVDVDIVAVPKSGAAKQQMREFLRSKSTMIYQDGGEKFSGKIDGVKVDVVFSEPKEYGAQLLYATGSAGHNIGLRRIAKQKGLKLSQHGLFKGKKVVAARTEREIYTALGRPRFKGPEERK